MVDPAVPDPPRLGQRERWGLALALALALGVRLTHLATVEPVPVVSDASGYDAAARRLVATGTLAFPVGVELWRDDVFREDAWAAYLTRPSNAWTMPGYPILVSFAAANPNARDAAAPGTCCDCA